MTNPVGNPAYAQTAVPLEWPDYNIGLVDAVKRGFKKYATFDGRASRREYWFWTLGIFLVSLVLYIPIILAIALGTDSYGHVDGAATGVMFLFGALLFIFALALIIPSLAVAVRRLHDGGYSGWMYLISFVPLVGGIALLVLMCMPTSHQKAPMYGPPIPDGWNPAFPGGHAPAGYQPGQPLPPYQGQPQAPYQGQPQAPHQGQQPPHA